MSFSGGQAQRTSLARAMYADADTYLFDDPLSALDANVGGIVFERCIRDQLRGRTRVLVTNQLQFLTQTDRIIMMKVGCGRGGTVGMLAHVLQDGRIAAFGTFQELQESSEIFRKFIAMEAPMGEHEPYEEGEPDMSKDRRGSKHLSTPCVGLSYCPCGAVRLS